ncbi:MAG: hypothetical protein EOO04_29775 [Chitinophagaceae bacterium]|nr:MAG: hypothetical protein EOO04_29775 [Chitinophagaceae bacterium]
MDISNRLAALVVATTLLFTACTKEDSSTSSSVSQTITNQATLPDLNKCKIRRIYQNFYKRETAVFTYNKVGNPFTVIYSNGGTGEHDHYFFYDSRNRLIKYQLLWGQQYVDEEHIYKYNDKDQIVTDSFKRSDGEGAYPYQTVSTIEYDSFGRVVKETIENTKNWDLPLEKVRRPTYTYDIRGNLAVAGWKSSSYDNKINPLRQNAVFQFVHRNYSMNNAAPQARYNSLGLPLSMKPTNDAFFNAFVTELVVYDCL